MRWERGKAVKASRNNCLKPTGKEQHGAIFHQQLRAKKKQRKDSLQKFLRKYEERQQKRKIGIK